MDVFWTLMRENVIIQGLISLVLIVTICVMYINGQNVPGELISIVLFVVGFYFGSKTMGTAYKQVSAQNIEDMKKNKIINIDDCD